jgi:hypothetical protein
MSVVATTMSPDRHVGQLQALHASSVRRFRELRDALEADHHGNGQSADRLTGFDLVQQLKRLLEQQRRMESTAASILRNVTISQHVREAAELLIADCYAIYGLAAEAQRRYTDKLAAVASGAGPDAARGRAIDAASAAADSCYQLAIDLGHIGLPLPPELASRIARSFAAPTDRAGRKAYFHRQLMIGAVLYRAMLWRAGDRHATEFVAKQFNVEPGTLKKDWRRNLFEYEPRWRELLRELVEAFPRRLSPEDVAELRAEISEGAKRLREEQKQLK